MFKGLTAILFISIVTSCLIYKMYNDSYREVGNKDNITIEIESGEIVLKPEVEPT